MSVWVRFKVPLLSCLFLFCGTTAARELAPTVCSSFLAELIRNTHRIQVDVLNHLATWDQRPDSISDRFAIIVGHDLAAGIVKVAEASQLLFCHASRCGHCSIEISAKSGSAVVEHIGFKYHFRRLAHLLLLSSDMARNILEYAQNYTITGQLESELDAATKDQYHKFNQNRSTIEALIDGKMASMAEDLLGHGTEPRTSQAKVSEHGLEQLRTRAAKVRDAVDILHHVVADLMDLIPLFAMSARTASKIGVAFGRPSVIAEYHRSLGKFDGLGQGAKIPWPRIMELAQDGNHKALAPRRSSAICDLDTWRLYHNNNVFGPLLDASPLYRDSSYVPSWHGASATALLETFERASPNARRAFHYLALYPKGFARRSHVCDETFGDIYDPTGCLDQDGWGNSVFFVGSASNDTNDREVYVTSRQRHWGRWNDNKNERDQETSSHTDGERMEWPPPLGHVLVDVLFLHPMAGNCALLPDLLKVEVRLLYVPINPTIPPPIRAAPDWMKFLQGHGEEPFLKETPSDLTLSYHLLAQCSVAQVVDALHPRGYRLLFVDHLFAVFTSAELAKIVLPDGSNVESTEEDIFNAWRDGWYCSPLSRNILQLEELARVDTSWIGIGAQGDAKIASEAAACEFMRQHGFEPDRQLMGIHSCDAERLDFTGNDQFDMPLETGSLLPAMVRRMRDHWAMLGARPRPGLGYHMSKQVAQKGVRVDADKNIGFTVGKCRKGGFCECFAPYRGPKCDIEDEGSLVARSRPFQAAINYIVEDELVHIAELIHGLKNLWSSFNYQFDYPVIIFHDDLTVQTRLKIVRAAPHRIWFHRLPDDFAPKVSNYGLQATGGKSFHSWSLGYRAQCRFRSGPMFAQDSVRRLDYLVSLDSDSMFPDQVYDFIKLMHLSPDFVLGYKHLTTSTPSAAKNLWEATVVYGGLAGVDFVEAYQTKGAFLRSLLIAPLGMVESPVWNLGVVMTDFEILRVSFYLPGGEYYKYFEYIDRLNGFWEHRWGDHAVRALGVSIVMWLESHGSRWETDNVRKPRDPLAPGVPKAFEMDDVPYAHQEACFCPKNQKCVEVDPNGVVGDHWPRTKKIWKCEKPAAPVFS